jgi:hypothetical protein
MHFSNEFFIWWFLFFWKIWHYFDIFLRSHFSFFLCDKHIVVISKVHYKSIVLLEFQKQLWWSPLKSMTIWIIKKLTMLILNMALNFMFVCNLEKIASVIIQIGHLFLLSPKLGGCLIQFFLKRKENQVVVAYKNMKMG